MIGLLVSYIHNVLRPKVAKLVRGYKDTTGEEIVIWEWESYLMDKRIFHLLFGAAKYVLLLFPSVATCFAFGWIKRTKLPWHWYELLLFCGDIIIIAATFVLLPYCERRIERLKRGKVKK